MSTIVGNDVIKKKLFSKYDKPRTHTMYKNDVADQTDRAPNKKVFVYQTDNTCVNSTVLSVLKFVCV